MKKLLIIILTLAVALPLSAQEDRKEVRSGNRLFRKGDYKRSEIDYRRALVKDSTSFAAGYDLASTLYRQEDYAGASSSLDKLKDAAGDSGYVDRYWFNKGDVALQQQDWGAAVEAFKQALLVAPGDMDAKESYVYARKKLEDQQNQDQNQNQDQQNQDQNQNQNQDQQNQQDQNKDQNDDKQDRNQDQQQDNQQQPQQGQMSPQEAQALLRAVQADDRKTQDKVNKEKAAQVGNRRNEKNW